MVQNSTGDPFEIYDTLKVLGEGSFGKVFKVIHRKNGFIRAMKVINKKFAGVNEEKQSKLINEINIMKKLDHPNILKVYEYFNTEKKLYIVTELCTGGELFDRILKMKYFSEKTVCHIMKQLLSAVFFCHSNKIIHRDLKPENILIESISSDINDLFNIKIIDFGTSDIFIDKKKLTEKIGSSFYMAPEVLLKSYNEKCDLWSCGVIMYILLSGVPPFEGNTDEETYLKVLNGKVNLQDNLWKNISIDGKDLIRKLLEKDANRRLSGREALDHIWFKSMGKNFENKKVENEKLENIANNLRNFRANQKLQHACLAYIVHNMMNKEEIEEYRKIFTQFDLNSDGRLTREELIIGLSSTMSDGEAKIEVDRIFDSIDGDKSNQIEFEEFLVAFMNKEKLLKEENLSSAFMLFDQDCSGKISTAEIKKILGGDSIVNEAVWTDILNEIDVNGDGEISYKEFREMMKKLL